jgi:hypothetical protein
MSTTDTADKLNAKLLPIPTAQRLDVFVCDGVPDEALARWQSQAGASAFHRPVDCHRSASSPASFCGIVLFVSGAQGCLDFSTSAMLKPFYARAGSETNAFEWQPIEKNFVRRGQDWFNERRPK